MFTFKFTHNQKDIDFGPNCHNYATACLKAKEYVDNLINSGWYLNPLHNDLIQNPYDFVLSKGSDIGRVVVGRLHFKQV